MDILPKDKIEAWKILYNFQDYDTMDKLAVLLRRPISKEMFEVWHDRINGSSARMRQVWVHQSFPANKGCCGH